MPRKRYISAQQLLEDSFELAGQILDSTFRPNFIVGVWRGGTPVGIAVQELLDFVGIETDHIAIRTSLYEGIEHRRTQVQVHGLNYLIKNVSRDDHLLVVDDVFDTGLSIDAILEELRHRCRLNLPKDVRVATAYYKPENNKTNRIPDFYVHEAHEWLVFPHEIKGLSLEEIYDNKKGLGEILKRYL